MRGIPIEALTDRYRISYAPSATPYDDQEAVPWLPSKNSLTGWRKSHLSRRERKFTLAEAIGRLAGPGAMKGVSPITRMQRAAVEMRRSGQVETTILIGLVAKPA
jgi:hypothetical protein